MIQVLTIYQWILDKLIKKKLYKKKIDEEEIVFIQDNFDAILDGKEFIFEEEYLINVI